MGNCLGIVPSFLSCVWAVITSVLSFHVGMFFLSFKDRDDCFWAAIFFFFFLSAWPCWQEVQNTPGRLLSHCCGSGNSVSVCWFHETHLMQLLTLVILVLWSKLLALILVFASDVNRSVCNCLFSPNRMDIIQSHKPLPPKTSNSGFLWAFWLLSCGREGCRKHLYA